jgi:hypothetical protein
MDAARQTGLLADNSRGVFEPAINVDDHTLTAIRHEIAQIME